MSAVDFSIVIPTCNRRPVLEKTLALLEAQETTLSFEVIVVNDGPAETLAGIPLGTEKRRSWKLLQNPKNRGRAATRNRGIQAASGRFILLLDDDIWAVSHLLQAHHARQQGIGGGVVVGAVPPAPEIEDTVWHRYIARKYVGIHQRLQTSELDFGLFLTGNVSLPAACLSKLGGFNERFKEYSFEDSELGYRLQQEGIRFAHAQEAVGYHLFSENLASICRKAFAGGRSLALFIAMHPELFHTMNCHSLAPSKWAGSGIAKNLLKTMLYNPLTRAALWALCSLSGAVHLNQGVFRFLPLLELALTAQGFRSGNIHWQRK